LLLETKLDPCATDVSRLAVTLRWLTLGSLCISAALCASVMALADS
jgi:hypothetical protein